MKDEKLLFFSIAATIIPKRQEKKRGVLRSETNRCFTSMGLSLSFEGEKSDAKRLAKRNESSIL